MAEVLRRNAADEERHYEWAVRTLERMGAGPETLVGRAEGAFEWVHEKTTDSVENVERRMMAGAESARRAAMEMPDRMRSTAGSGLDVAAGAIDRAGRWVESRDGAAAGRVGTAVHGVADSLETAADYLRTRDFDAMRTDFEQQVRVHPLRTALIAVGAGFLLGRILR